MAKVWATGDKVLAADLNLMVCPAGALLPFAGTAIPSNWLLCDGTAVSRTTYADLFTAVSTTYGVGDGSTTFNLPDLRGRIPVGLNSSDTEFDTLSETGGEKAHTLTSGEMPSHTHVINTGSGGGSDANRAQVASTVSNPATSATMANTTGGGTSHNNLQPYITLRYIIRY